MNKEKHMFTEEELDEINDIVIYTIYKICEIADKQNLDRDNLLKFYSNLVHNVTEYSTINEMKVRN